MSVLSAVIVGGALTVALTNGSFELDRGPAIQPATAASPFVGLGQPTTPPATPSPQVVQPAQKVVYYIVSSQEQASVLAGARRADAMYFSAQGVAPSPPTTAYYVMCRSSAEAREGERLLHDLANLAPDYGIEFYIVDLRE